jgi:UrcA family protein
MQPRTNSLLRAGALIVFLGLAGLAAAESPNQRVESRDLDLSRFADVEALYGRIRSAARSVCRADRASWDVKRVLHARLCVEDAIESAIAQADQPLLTTVHRAFQERLAQR